jgi:hypothetical protein
MFKVGLAPIAAPWVPTNNPSFFLYHFIDKVKVDSFLNLAKDMISWNPFLKICIVGKEFRKIIMLIPHQSKLHRYCVCKGYLGNSLSKCDP